MRIPTFVASFSFLLPLALDAASAQCEAKLVTTGASALDRLGSSADVFGDLAVLGAPEDDDLGPNAGAVHVFELVGDVWVLRSKLTASDGAAGHLFGTCVSIHGATILVGASAADGAQAETGAAYVFERTGDVWTEAAKLVAVDGESLDEFGHAVALYQGSALVGAPGDDLASGGDAGSAYFYVDTPGGWTFVDKASAADAGPGDAFGTSVSIHGETAVIGAPNDDLGTGAGYVLTDTGAGWVQTQKLLASDGESGDILGDSVGLFDSALVLGSPGDDDRGSFAGAAYVFERGEAGVFGEFAKLLPAELQSTDNFGRAVDIDRFSIVVGAFADDDLGGSAGAVYPFERDTEGWFQVGKHLASDGGAFDLLGVSVAVENGRVLAGAPGDDDSAGNAGAAYVFDCVDCNGNGIHDPQDIAALTSPDCNGNRIPDECDIALGTSGDCNDNSVPDECDVPGGAYCSCDSNAPCGNHAVGGCRNSLLQGAVIEACGTSSVTADDLVLTARRLPFNVFGLYFMGPRQGRVPFGDGQRCVFPEGGVATFRYGVQSTGPMGRTALGPGLVALSHMRFAPSGRIAAGDTWNFQFWHRDPMGPCGSGFNLSSAFEVLFTP